MILSLPITQQKLAPGNLFLSVDFVTKAESMWFRNVKGYGAACYYLTYYSWDAGKAIATAKGLSCYLELHHGHDCTHNFFSADHWIATK